MFALVSTSHQKSRVLRGFHRKQKLNGEKTADVFQFIVPTTQKKLEQYLAKLFSKLFAFHAKLRPIAISLPPPPHFLGAVSALAPI